MAEKLFINRHMDGSSFFWKGSPTGILLLHGFTATTVEIRHLAKYLHERGYTISGPLLPGHGTTIDDLNSKKWQNWTNAAEDALARLQKTCSQIFIGGESMGGLIALFLASRGPQLKGLLLYSPALHTPGVAWASLLAPFRKYIPPKTIDENTPWQGYAVKPLRATVEFGALQKIVRKILPQVEQPVIIFQGRNEHTIDPNSSQIVYESIRSQDRQIQWMENSGHCVLLEPEAEIVCEKSLLFIQQHESPNP